MTEQLKVDREFEDHLRPLTPEEKHDLRESLQREGCLQPILVWKEERTIVDGHHRYAICQELGISFNIQNMPFDSREQVLDFIVSHQFGRRNLSPLQTKYYRGREYLRFKSSHGGNHVKAPSAHFEHLAKTAERLAKKHGISSATIRRDAAFAQEVDALPPEQRQEVLSGNRKLRRNKQTQQGESASTSPSKNGLPLSPSQKIDRIESELHKLRESRQAIRKVLDTSLQKLPGDRVEAAIKELHALVIELGRDEKSLSSQIKKIQQRAAKPKSIPKKKSPRQKSAQPRNPAKRTAV